MEKSEEEEVDSGLESALIVVGSEVVDVVGSKANHLGVFV